MERLTDISAIRELLTRHGFTFSKSLGQNFLINPTVCPRMAQAAVKNDRTGVIEIGPGIGVLTRELSLLAKKVVAIELDERLLPVLDETLADCGNVEVVNADALTLDLGALINERLSDCDSISVCANLPYYITSPLIMKLLEDGLPFSSITVMVQKEAAQRLCAPVGSRDAGAVTVAVAYYAEAIKLFNVSRGSFMPSPNVDSAVISLELRDEPPYPVGRKEIFFRLIKAGFSQRRKTLLNSLCSGGFLTREQAATVLDAAGIPQNARIEELSFEKLSVLSRCADFILT